MLKETKKTENTEERDKLIEIWERANRSIVTNEDLSDKQVLIIVIAIFIQTIGIIKFLEDYKDNFDLILAFIILVLSFFSIAMVIIIPVHFISKRRELKDKLEEALNNEEKTYDCKDLVKIESDVLKVKGLNRKIKIHYLEIMRLCLVGLLLFTSFVFYFKMGYNLYMNNLSKEIDQVSIEDSPPVHGNFGQSKDKGVGEDSVPVEREERGSGPDSLPEYQPERQEGGAGEDSPRESDSE